MRDYAGIYRDLVMRKFWWEARLGLQIAFYRTYAVPSIARLLVDTGEITDRPIKRGFDTGLIIYELIHHGFEHPRGRQMVAALNRMHHLYDIRADEYRYVLGALIYVPSRHIDRFAGRRLSAVEREATFRFYHRLGELMNIADLPATDAEYEAEFDEYERTMFAYDPAAAELIKKSRSIAVERFPRPLRPMASAMHDAVLDAPMRHALGVTKPRSSALWLGALQARRAVKRLLPLPRKEMWYPGIPNPAYPDGYELEQLGPASLRAVPRR